MNEKIRLGISSCLLGNPVRYDGGHKWDRFLTDTLGRYVEYVPVCPEVECGLSVPREAMRLVGDPDAPTLVTVKTGIDLTGQMDSWARNRVLELEKKRLNGFIFKKDSPSSGMERVKVYTKNNMPVKKGSGLFAKIFMEHFPLLPVEDEGRLHDPAIRENFIERIFTYKRWREMIEENKTASALIEFHSRHKLLILAHSPKHYQSMGKLVAEAGKTSTEQLFEKYRTDLMEALKIFSTPGKNANVLQHMMGYFKNYIDRDEKKELDEIITAYRNELIPLIVPVTLLNHYIRKYDSNYLKKQHFLNPHPLELKLRNHV